jgi:hypothetical protein
MLPHRYDERGSASHRAFAHVTFSTGTATLRCSRSNAEKWRYERHRTFGARACNERIIIEDNAFRYKIGSRCAGT